MKHFKVGNSIIADLPRTGRQRRSTRESTKRKFDVLITEGRVKVRHITEQPDIGYNAVQDMIRLWDTGNWVVALSDC
jgi:hypothetical protein